MKTFVQLILLSLLALSCSPKKVATEVTAGNWGHLIELEETTPSKLYLSHVKKGETYRVCLPRYMTETYPGIENEVKAAINIWGHYVGRRILVDVVTADLPELLGVSENELMETYYKECPKDVHLVMGFYPFSDSQVGETGSRFTYYPRGQRYEVVSFKRYLFLRTPVAANTPVNRNKTEVIWKSLAEAQGKILSEQEILDLMLARKTTVTLPKRNQYVTFPTLVHEFGHVWGLCDQYDLGNGTTNCDANFATLDESGHIIIHDEATMAKSRWASPIFLSDDDIEGIRRLAERPYFAHNWPTSDEFRRIGETVSDTPKEEEKSTPPAPETDNGTYVVNVVDTNDEGDKEVEEGKKVSHKVVSSAAFNSLQAKGLKVILDMDIVTMGPVVLEVAFFDGNTETWYDLGSVNFPQAVDYSNYQLTLNMNRFDRPTKVRISIGTAGADESEKTVLEGDITRQ